MNTQEGNKLIAEFIGMKFQHISIDSHNYEQYSYGLPDELSVQVYGYKGATCFLDDQFYKSWDWLMPVVEKIEEMCNYEKTQPFFSVESFDIKWDRKYPNRKSRAWISICTKLNGLGSEFHNIISEPNDSKIQAVFEAVLEFIAWYNHQKVATP